jgi:hypothetical protein
MSSVKSRDGLRNEEGGNRFASELACWVAGGGFCSTGAAASSIGVVGIVSVGLDLQ